MDTIGTRKTNQISGKYNVGQQHMREQDFRRKPKVKSVKGQSRFVFLGAFSKLYVYVEDVISFCRSYYFLRKKRKEMPEPKTVETCS